MTSESLIEKLKWRYATKRFDSTRKIDAKTWTILEEALVLTPSSYGMQPWRFAVITNSELKTKLRAHSWNQPQIEESSHLVVFLAKETITEADIDHYIDTIAAVRGVSREKMNDYRNMMVGDLVQGDRSSKVLEWASRQTYIALGNLMTSAAILEVDACPMEGIDAARYDEILAISGYKTRCVLALGYRSPDDKYSNLAKVRFPHTEVIVRR